MLINLTKRLCLHNCDLSQTSQQPIHPKCTLSAKKSISSITKLVIFSRSGQLPSFFAPNCCCASPTALRKTKGGVWSITVGVNFRSLVAKCVAQETSSEAVEFFLFRQMGVAVNCSAESIVQAT